MNEIQCIIYDGTCNYEKHSNGTYKIIPHKIFSTDKLIFVTPANFLIGDIIYPGDGKQLTVIQRIYHIKTNSFTFICRDIYTGREE